jgi:hypothetical protein
VYWGVSQKSPPVFQYGGLAMQSRFNSVIEVTVGRVGMLLLAAVFSLWWIPAEAGSFLESLWVTWPYVAIAWFWNLAVRRGFEMQFFKSLARSRNGYPIDDH